MPPPVPDTETSPGDWSQPARGYRFTGDSVSLSRFLPERAEGTVCDLGAGCGVLLLEAMAAGRLKGAGELVLVERDPDFRTFIEANVARARSLVPDLPPVRTLLSDWRDLAAPDLGGAASLVCSNPPYFRPGTGRPPACARSAAAAPVGATPGARWASPSPDPAAGRRPSPPASPGPPASPAGQDPPTERPSRKPSGAPPPGEPSRPVPTPTAAGPDLAGRSGRWELFGGIGSMAGAAARILRPGGTLLLCFPRSRLPELLAAASRSGLVPDIMSFPASRSLPLALLGLHRPPHP
ncbi:MAG: hypothetical protein LBQ79_02365 [Deltaproteobacteria bacterium]|jgi:tRNA1(Val) A37 N6-methylase TrmN6|nr:hypothetical protein [Deltaproteobacteria bacterium]